MGTREVNLKMDESRIVDLKDAAEVYLNLVGGNGIVIKYLPYIVTTKDKADTIMDGEIPFTPIIPNEFADIPSLYPLEYLKRGITQQLEDGAIVDLSDFSSTAMTMLTCKPDERIRQYGDTAIVITAPQVFFQRLCSVNDVKYPNLKYMYASDVIYDDGMYDENIGSQVCNPCVHRKADEWKQEVIILSRVKQSIALKDNVKGDDIFTIPEGIRDIAVEVDIGKINGDDESVWNNAIDRFENYKIDMEEESYPLLTGVEISVSGNIQEICPETVWIEKLKMAFDDRWQPFTRVLASFDGKSEVPCLGFTNGMDEVLFSVNTMSFRFAVGNPMHQYLATVSKVIALVETECKTRFCNPSIILTANMGDVTGEYVKNREFEIKKSVFDRGITRWYGLSINNRVKTSVFFGIPQCGKKQWMLREQAASFDNTLWYDKERIDQFLGQASDEIRTHMSSLVSTDVVDGIMRS